jgi:hypothetical protein
MHRRQCGAFPFACTLNSRRILLWAGGGVRAGVKQMRVFDARYYV